MTESPVELRDRWFSHPDPRPAADVRLFCLPHAGSGASVFRPWPAAFGPRVEVVAVQLPGREQRMRERPVIEPARVADAIAGEADRPFAIFGHSMGGRLAFEVARELRRTGRQLPLRLYASGTNPPHLPTAGPFAGLSTVADEELMTRLAEAGGVPQEVLAVPELFALFLPVLRADLGWVDDYTLVEEPPLPMPVVAFAGETDPVATPELMRTWDRHTEAAFTLHTFPGGHFFLHEHLDRLSDLIEADLLGTGLPR
jgi:surfactin synthase thioesterase subunit